MRGSLHWEKGRKGPEGYPGFTASLGYITCTVTATGFEFIAVIARSDLRRE